MRIFTVDGSDVAFFAVGQEATGIIAFGQMATGVIAIGQVATGVVAIGQLSRGVIAVGQLAVGVFTLGMLSVGVLWASGMVGCAPFAGFGLILGFFGKLNPLEVFDPRRRWTPTWAGLPPWRIFVGVAGTLALAVGWWMSTGMWMLLPQVTFGLSLGSS